MLYRKDVNGYGGHTPGICHYAASARYGAVCSRRRRRETVPGNTLLLMTTGPGRTARELFVAADEALTQAAFCTGEFTTAERLFGEARAVAARGGDLEAEARAVGGLGMMHHYRNIATLVGGQALADADIVAEDDLMRRALALSQEAGDPAGAARALFGAGLVLQALRRDWDAAMRYFWPAFGLAEALEESGDLYGRSEIHRHIGFYYLAEDVRPREAVRQLGHSLALRERLKDPRRIPSALVALGEAEMAAGNLPRATELFCRAVPLAHEAALLPWRIADAEQNLQQAEAAAAAEAAARA
jgi:tetratricopeptide (TPR) repeat protein